MSAHRDEWLDRDDDERAADRFAWAVVLVVALASLVGLAAIATNRWPT